MFSSVPYTGTRRLSRPWFQMSIRVIPDTAWPGPVREEKAKAGCTWPLRPESNASRKRDKHVRSGVKRCGCVRDSLPSLPGEILFTESYFEHSVDWQHIHGESAPPQSDAQQHVPAPAQIEYLPREAHFNNFPVGRRH
jgi:hypothetical protein